MMKWGRKKPASSVSSSRFPSLSHVLPASWSSMFKRMSINTTAKPAKQKSVEKLNAVHVTGSVNYGGVGDGGRFYRGDNDAFWRLSFHEENVDGRTSRRELKSVWYDSENELNFPSSCEICGSNMSRERGKVGTEKSSRAAWEAKLMNEIHRDAEIFAGKETYKKEKAMIIKTPRPMDEEYLTTKKSTKRVMGGKSFRIERNRGGAEGMPATSVEESALELKSSKAVPIIGMDNLKLQEECLRRQKQIPYENPTCSDSITTKEDNLFCGHKLPETDELQPQCLSSQRITLKDRKIKQLMEKSDKQRKSVHVGRELESRGTKQKSKVKVFSPRTVARTEICKVRALEDMKKAKLKTKAAEGRTRKDRTGLENFAMVKFSADPEKDFRDSMIEMIVEKGISQSEELEALLACYLTLNSDEYHDLIIKVFREVWTKLDEARFDIELLNQQYLHNFLLSSSK